MGAHLVGLVLTIWAPHVSDRAFRLLTRMAHTALDEPTITTPAGLYFGGREPLIAVLSAKSRKGKPETIYKEIRTLTAELVEKGAIERTNYARSGINQCYQLTLDRAPRIDASPVDNRSGRDRQEGRTAPPLEGRTAPPQGGSTTPPRGGAQPPPRSKEEPLEEKHKETPGFHEPVTPARANAERELEFIPPPQCGYPGCSRGWIIPTDPTEPLSQCPQCNSNVIPFPERKTA